MNTRAWALPLPQYESSPFKNTSETPSEKFSEKSARKLDSIAPRMSAAPYQRTSCAWLRCTDMNDMNDTDMRLHTNDTHVTI